MTVPGCKRLRLILGDQLNDTHHWFSARDPDALYLLAELRQEATYVRHHVQKVAAFFAAMKAFAERLDAAGHRVLRLDLDDTREFADLPALLTRVIEASGAERFEYQRPDEYRLLAQLRDFCKDLAIESSEHGTEHFLLPFDGLGDEFPRGKRLLMEHFYRRMRRRLGILVDGQGQPEGGRWNFDTENRRRLPAQQALPEPLLFDNPVSGILERIRRHALPVLGRLEGGRLAWPVSREQSLDLLRFFTRECLPRFGPYQDALTSRGWSLFHSRLSFALNTKMVSPAEVVDAAIAAWRADPGQVGLPAVEGFVRQVIGWREFMRGMYWANMPGYQEQNYFGHDRELPRFYWDGDTRMACMAHAIDQSLEHAYAHHIQRLMVTGNFALLAGIRPSAVDDWYLGIYIDAIQWVELPNTRGMSQYADGGLVASKPYSASGNYLNRMGDYCGQCAYDVKRKTGAGSCPFNSLYWHFMARNRDKLAVNPRLGMTYRTWERMDEDLRRAVLETAEAYLQDIDAL